MTQIILGASDTSYPKQTNKDVFKERFNNLAIANYVKNNYNYLRIYMNKTNPEIILINETLLKQNKFFNMIEYTIHKYSNDGVRGASNINKKWHYS